MTITMIDLDTGWTATVPTANAAPDRLQTAERTIETLRAQLDMVLKDREQIIAERDALRQPFVHVRGIIE